MPTDRETHHRRSIRLPGYDYAASGAYFITICTPRGELLFGDVVEGEMVLNQWGQIAHEEWLASEGIRRELKPDAFVVMPNHIHGIVWIVATGDARAQGVASRIPVRAHGRAPQHTPVQRTPPPRTPLQRAPRSLGSFVAGYKSAVTKRINQMRGTPGQSVWQRNYWEHVVRNEESLNRIREYIENNPARWAEDQLHPDAPPNRFNRWPP
jgi:putative transposase